jgi:hypothetical protein
VLVGLVQQHPEAGRRNSPSNIAASGPFLARTTSRRLPPRTDRRNVRPSGYIPIVKHRDGPRVRELTVEHPTGGRIWEPVRGPGEHDARAHGVGPLDVVGAHPVLGDGGGIDLFGERRFGLGSHLGDAHLAFFERTDALTPDYTSPMSRDFVMITFAYTWKGDSPVSSGEIARVLTDGDGTN